MSRTWGLVRDSASLRAGKKRGNETDALLGTSTARATNGDFHDDCEDRAMPVYESNTTDVRATWAVNARGSDQAPHNESDAETQRTLVMKDRPPPPDAGLLMFSRDFYNISFFWQEATFD